MTPTAAADLLFRPVTELADLVRKGEVTSRELVEASLDRIEALNPTLNAFVALDAERALAAADAIGPGDERPFAGVPIGIKDVLHAEGMPTVANSQTTDPEALERIEELAASSRVAAVTG